MDELNLRSPDGIVARYISEVPAGGLIWEGIECSIQQGACCKGCLAGMTFSCSRDGGMVSQSGVFSQNLCSLSYDPSPLSTAEKSQEL